MSEEDRSLLHQPSELYSPSSRSKRVLVVAGVALAVVLLVLLGFTAGILTGIHVGDNQDDGGSSAQTADYNWGANVKIDGKEVPVVDFLDNTLKAENMKENLEFLTKYPHIAGSEENHRLASSIYSQWANYSFDKVELVNYTVYLSYSNQSNPNVLLLKNSSGDVIYNASTAQEPPLTPGENDSTVARPFNAYSGPGNASGPLVYVNFGRFEDFHYLTTNLSLDLTGYVCIVRYGGIFRGNKALLAKQFGCVGVLIYSDPQQYAPKNGPPVYPEGPNLPPGGVQRGSLLIPPGDPLTPGIPAIDGVYRRDYQEAVDDSIVTSIPTQPISYGDAIHFMQQLSRYKAPEDWVGQLNITYYIMQEESNSNTTYLQINNYQEEKMIYDVVGTIYGSVEPDRYVVLGNHRDAWVFGAVDPNSGTAPLMEIARALGELRKNNWRPGRTIILCSWDAEEMSLIGSTEWVEDRGKQLGANTVAYLNVDVGVQGSITFGAAATPLLYAALFEATKIVKAENPGFNTVYDEWLHYTNTTYNGTVRPTVGDLGSGSDFTSFLQYYGISSTTMGYGNRTGYAVYHSVHDNFYWMTHFGDPSFTHHLAMGLVWSKLAILIATTPVLPYDPRYYALAVERIYTNLEAQYHDVLEEQNITLAYLNESVHTFTRSTVDLWLEIEKVVTASDQPSENVVRIINDKLMNIERAFILPEGIPGRPYYKHVVFAPSAVNSYGSSLFPGISDTIFNATYYGQSWNDVRRQIDVVRVHLLYASRIMTEPSLKYVQ